MTEELKPCPFCGSFEVHGSYLAVDDRCNGYDYAIRCRGCGAIFKHAHGQPKDVTDAWNRRVKE